MLQPRLFAVLEQVLGCPHTGGCTSHQDASVNRRIARQLVQVLLHIGDDRLNPVFVTSQIHFHTRRLIWRRISLVPPEPYLIQVRRPFSPFDEGKIVVPADQGQELEQRAVCAAVDAGKALDRIADFRVAGQVAGLDPASAQPASRLHLRRVVFRFLPRIHQAGGLKGNLPPQFVTRH